MPSSSIPRQSGPTAQPKQNPSHAILRLTAGRCKAACVGPSARAASHTPHPSGGLTRARSGLSLHRRPQTAMLIRAPTGIPSFLPLAENEADMDKREFLKTSGAMVAGSMISHVIAGQEPGTPRENWAGNLNYSTDQLHTPSTLEEVQQVVKRCATLRALGSRHSFSTI